MLRKPTSKCFANSGAKGDTGEPGAKGDTGLIGTLTYLVVILVYSEYFCTAVVYRPRY